MAAGRPARLHAGFPTPYHPAFSFSAAGQPSIHRPNGCVSSTAYFATPPSVASSSCQSLLRLSQANRSPNTPASCGKSHPGCPAPPTLTAPTNKKLRAAMVALATFHNAVADMPASDAIPVPVRHLLRLRELSPHQINQLSSAVTDTIWPDLALLARQFLAALPRAIPPAIAQLEPLATVKFPVQPCIRDIWHDHVLYTGDEVTGLIDFGALDMDTPATDVARLLGSFASITPHPFREGQGEGSLNVAPVWQVGLAAYNTIRALTPDETSAVHALHTSGTVLAGCNWIHWIYRERRQFDEQPRIIERFKKIVAIMVHE